MSGHGETFRVPEDALNILEPDGTLFFVQGKRILATNGDEMLRISEYANILRRPHDFELLT